MSEREFAAGWIDHSLGKCLTLIRTYLKTHLWQEICPTPKSFPQTRVDYIWQQKKLSPGRWKYNERESECVWERERGRIREREMERKRHKHREKKYDGGWPPTPTLFRCSVFKWSDVSRKVFIAFCVSVNLLIGWTDERITVLHAEIQKYVWRKKKLRKNILSII